MSASERSFLSPAKGPACSRKPLTVLINTCSLQVREALIVNEMVFWFPD